MSDWNAQELEALPTRYRGNLINGIAGFKPVLLVGTADEQGQTNLALFSSVFHILDISRRFLFFLREEAFSSLQSFG